jgi:hypothetical protein
MCKMRCNLSHCVKYGSNLSQTRYSSCWAVLACIFLMRCLQKIPYSFDRSQGSQRKGQELSSYLHKSCRAKLPWLCTEIYIHWGPGLSHRVTMHRDPPYTKNCRHCCVCEQSLKITRYELSVPGSAQTWRNRKTCQIHLGRHLGLVFLAKWNVYAGNNCRPAVGRGWLAEVGRIMIAYHLFLSTKILIYIWMYLGVQASVITMAQNIVSDHFIPGEEVNNNLTCYFSNVTTARHPNRACQQPPQTFN